MTTHEPSAPTCPHPRRTLVAMTGSLCMIFLDATVVGVALPTITSSLDMSTSQAAWVVNAFLVAMASSLALGGRIGDRFGRLLTFRISIIVFVGASLACGMATSIWLLITARAVQGIAAGCMQPSSTAVVISAVPADKRGRSMAAYFGTALLFLMAGPVIGGLLVQYADWRWIFLLNVPVGAVSLGLGIALALPPRRRIARGFDPLGAALVLLGMPVLILGLEWFAHPPAHAPWLPWPLTVVGSVLTVLCIVRALRSDAPLLNVRLISSPPMLGQATLLCLVSLVMSAQAVYGPILLQELLGFTPLQAGLACLPLLLPVVCVIHPAGRWYDRSGAFKPAVVGMSICTLGLIIEVLGVHAHTYALLAVGMALVGIGSTIASTPTNTDLLSRAPAESLGETSGLVQTMRQFGASVGITLSVLAIAITMSIASPSTTGHGEPINTLVSRAEHGDIEALDHLRTDAPKVAEEVLDARTRGMTVAFSMQAVVSLVALVVVLTIGRTRGKPDQ